MKKNSSSRFFFKDFNRAYYTSDGYDDYLKRYRQEGQKEALALLKKIKPAPSWRFLDAGCGMGGLILALRKLNYKAWGIEASPFCLKRSPAKKWISSGNVCQLPFPDNAFEVVTCVDVLCYLTRFQTKKAVEELVRVAKYYLYVETICRGSPNSDQQLNPDRLRNDRALPTRKFLKNLLLKNQISFLTPLYSPAFDFNGLFAKTSVSLLKSKHGR